jgi:hypothetical protein
MDGPGYAARMRAARLILMRALALAAVVVASPVRMKVSMRPGAVVVRSRSGMVHLWPCFCSAGRNFKIAAPVTREEVQPLDDSRFCGGCFPQGRAAALAYFADAC